MTSNILKCPTCGREFTRQERVKETGILEYRRSSTSGVSESYCSEKCQESRQPNPLHNCKATAAQLEEFWALTNHG